MIPALTFAFRIIHAVLRAAVLYDFIPMDWPGYLPTRPRRMEYIAKLARLRNLIFSSDFGVYGLAAQRITGSRDFSNKRDRRLCAAFLVRHSE